MNWIACKDKMPSMWESVLVWTVDGYWAKTQRSGNAGSMIWIGEECCFDDKEVTHWMAIEPPSLYIGDSDHEPNGGPFVVPNSPC